MCDASGCRHRDPLKYVFRCYVRGISRRCWRWLGSCYLRYLGGYFFKPASVHVADQEVMPAVFLPLKDLAETIHDGLAPPADGALSQGLPVFRQADGTLGKKKREGSQPICVAQMPHILAADFKIIRAFKYKTSRQFRRRIKRFPVRLF